MNYLQICFFWVLYYAIHSILAATSVKKWTKHYLPFIYNYYRIIYNCIAIIGLYFLIQITFKDQSLLFNSQSVSTVFSIILMLTGLVVLVVSFISFDKMEFLGLKKEVKKENSHLIIHGIYHYVRHPLYTGIIFFVSGIFFYQPTIANFLVAIISFLYIEIGSRLEEKKLLIEFGEEYLDYSKKVKRYFPYIY